MKRLLHILSILLIGAVIFSACNSRLPADANNGKVMTYVDTIGLADFQKWKVQNEIKDPMVYYQQGNVAGMNRPVKTLASKRSYSSAPKTTSAGSGSMNSVSEYPAKTTMKKGWSRKAKGAVIGGGSGAVIGALINKNNRLVGGALGGALGAGIGYVIGNEMDRKHGR
jgi:hypothetical protein